MDNYTKAASSMYLTGNTKEALAIVARAPAAIEIGSDGMLQLTKARCLEKLNRYEEAVSVLSKLIAEGKSKKVSYRADFVNAGLSRAFDERAKCYDKLGDKAKASADRQAQEQWSKGVENDLFGK
jgi:tetratricopeptide (TPR) repeat protein